MDDVTKIVEIEQEIEKQELQLTNTTEKNLLQRRLDRQARHSIISTASDVETDDEASSDYEDKNFNFDVENSKTNNNSDKIVSKQQTMQKANLKLCKNISMKLI